MISRSLPIVAGPLTLALVVGPIGCEGQSQTKTEWDGTARDSAGVLLVENLGTPLWTEEDRWALSEVLRIGSLEGEPEYQFGSISGYAPLSDGRIAITDDHAQNLRFFSPDGVHLRTVGTAGSGPRDFGSGRLSVLVGPGDTILVMDWANRQTHVLDSQGDWLDSWKFHPEGGRRVAGWDTAPSGLVINLLSPLQTPDTPVSDTLDAVVIRDVRGHVVDTLAWIRTTRGFSLRGGEQELRFYSGRPTYDLRWNGGVVVGETDLYRLRWFGPDGSLERIVSMRRDKIPFDGSEQTATMSLFERVWDTWGMPPQRVDRVKSTIRFEDHYPAYRLFKHGPHETLWVQQVRPTSDLTPVEIEAERGVYPWPYGSPKWDVFNAEGRYLGVVNIPTELRLPLFFGDRLYAIWRDELDVDYLAVMEIVGLPPSDARLERPHAE